MALTDGRPPRPGQRRSPFDAVAPAVVVALASAVAVAVWIAVGDRLPGGRWLAVHLFTLGVLTTVIVAFSQHFGHTVTRAPGDVGRWQTAVVTVGTVALLIGIPTATPWVTASGATVVTAVVVDSYVRLRRMRRRAVGARFAWIARVYERAHGAFVHGAVLGLLLGVGLLPGAWYGAGRIAHLHVNALGWAGLTLLATLVFFGPTMVRTRIEDGADGRAAVALRHGATALTVAVLLLLASGVGGQAATVTRVAAAAALGVYAWAVGVVCLPVFRAARAAKPSMTRASVVAVCLWFPVVAWADVVVVATGELRLLDAVGLAALAGVLGQAVTTAVGYVTPALRGRSNTERSRIIGRLSRGATARTIAYNIGVAVVVASAAAGPTLAAVGVPVVAAGWLLVLGALAVHVAAALWPVRRAP